ncbi:MAG: hypothetical protein AAGA48_11580 [Myxococcota bacterium]
MMGRILSLPTSWQLVAHQYAAVHGRALVRHRYGHDELTDPVEAGISGARTGVAPDKGGVETVHVL